ncbi:GPP34 family phosphoprotein [Microbacterium sp. NPDC077184]|uniref:GOLPH3/VPS74 family protein n=1 Tax=Microbacterium sp. NPDC077184 TaxID=3154764 RepID=UPI003447C9ED
MSEDRTIPAASSPAEPSLVGDVLLLLFQPDSGTIAGENVLFYVLGGAAVTDLALTGAVEVDGRRLFARPVSATGDERPEDELVAPVWDYLQKKPRDVQTVLAAVGPNLREPALERLVARGELRAETRKTLGLFPSTHYTLGGDRRAELIAGVRAALVGGADPDARTAALAGLLSASDTLPWFDREIPWNSAVYTRGKAFEQGDWGAAAAASAVARTVVAGVASSLVIAGVISSRP